jgi:hypothetical protein
MQCPKCQHDNRSERRFCAECGAADLRAGKQQDLQEPDDAGFMDLSPGNLVRPTTMGWARCCRSGKSTWTLSHSA